MTVVAKSNNASEDAGWNLEQFVTYRIARLNAQMNQQATRLLDQMCDLTLGQWRVMAAIGAGKARTSRKIHDVTKMDTGLISRLLRQLEMAGYITTHRNLEDRRVLDVNLTPKGIETFTRIFPVMAERQKKLLKGFSKGDFQQLNMLLDRLQNAVAE